jgi:hypothetical protein
MNRWEDEMAILAIFTGRGLTPALYDALRAEAHWETKAPKGGVIHIAGFDETGAHVADVWDSEADMNAFVAERLMPAFQKLQAPPPEVVIYPVHNINAYAPVDRYRTP